MVTVKSHPGLLDAKGFQHPSASRQARMNNLLKNYT